jgi:glycosyltransferase involved in cell wall biosynthesis
LRAAHDVLGGHGIEVVALETASDSAVYDWSLHDGPTPFPRETVFPGEVYDDITPERMHHAVTAALDRLDPDAVHIHSYSTPDARACLAWCRRHHRIATLMAESRQGDAARTPWREAIKRVLVTAFDAAQASGSASTRYYRGLGMPAHRIATGYSVVDNDYFAERAAAIRREPETARTLPGLGDATPFFFASARFMERKDLPCLLHAYAAYRRRASESGAHPWRLLLLGDGPLRPSLESIVREEHIGDHVAMPGWRQIEDLPAYYALAAAFVHTATVDQWGLVVNEAMAAGLPVVVSTGTGCSEDLVRDGENGFTFRPGDADALSRHLFAIAHEVDRNAFAERSREIIAAWPLERFGTSLHDALCDGAEAAPHRGRGVAARFIVALLRRIARSPRSFHAVQD